MARTKGVRVTNKTLQLYAGGQMEIQNPDEQYLYRGEIETIRMIVPPEVEEVEESELVVRFNWLAKAEGYPSAFKWIADAELDYRASLFTYKFFDVGADSSGIPRLGLRNILGGEVVILFRPEDENLDPARVAGLDLSKLKS